MSSAGPAIPYEKQSPELTGRACGATCLSMVYQSFGKKVSQGDIWPAIAKENRFGQVSSTTHLMAQDAVNRGLKAVVIQARHPFEALRLCRETGVRAILNHRVRNDSASGHYTVLVDVDAKDVVVHDPLLGEARRMSHAELAQVWLPQLANSEIVGGVLIAVSAANSPDVTCEFCHTTIPHFVTCQKCAKPVGLTPATVLGCIKDDCIARMWSWVCCPACDFTFTFDAGVPVASSQPAPAGAPSASVPQLDIPKLFAALDQFTSLAQSVPAAANHPDIKKQLEIIANGKEQLKVANAAAVARRAAVVGQLEALTRKHQQQTEEQLKKIEEINTPPPPLDGDALARALLKSLGFIQ